MDNIVSNNENFNAVMSSREIADLCDKRHAHILRDIEKMIQDIDEPKFGLVDFEHEYQDAKGQMRKEYRLPKDLTVTLITGYRADLRYKVVKRLEELEANPHQIPQTMGEALQLAADQCKQIELMKGDVAALGQIANADGSMSFRVAAKNLQLRPIDMANFMSHNGWIFRQSQKGPWLGYQTKITSGLLEHKVTTVDRSDGSEKVVTQCRVTAKGLTKLAKLIPTAVQGVA